MSFFWRSKTSQEPQGVVEEKASDKFRIRILREEPCEVVFTVEASWEIVQQEAEQVSKNFQQRAKFPGYRAGKVPLEVVRRNLEISIKEQTMENLIRGGVQDVLEDKRLRPVGSPQVSPQPFDWEKSFSFELKIEKFPSAEPEGYREIHLEKKVKQITEQEVESEIEQLRERNTWLVPSSSEIAEKEHCVVVSYEATRDGQKLPGSTSENELVDLSAPQTIAGFAEALLGARRGETRQISTKDLSERPIFFKVTLKEIKEKKIPSLEGELLQDLGYANVEDLRQSVREGLKAKVGRQATEALKDQVDTQLLESNPFPVPSAVVEMRLKDLVLDSLRQNRIATSMREEELKKQAELLSARYRPLAEQQVRLTYLLNLIAQKESIGVSESELEEEKQKLMTTKTMNPQEVQLFFQKRKDSILSALREKKVYDFILQHAKIKEVSI